MKFNSVVERQLEQFRSRSDTFSLGVCNGCQLMALLGWVGAQEDGSQGTLLAHNDSERFESRFASVSIEDGTPAIMLKDMHTSVLGTWVAHGEGKFTFASEAVRAAQNSGKCVAIRYTDDAGKPTTRYPMNPNGSVDAIAGLCSPDGRHLAMMPHPERCTLMWQWPYIPTEWDHVKISPWLKMFSNAYDWCRATS
jgi:phosphoribosylformylglycinamidine synthase